MSQQQKVFILGHKNPDTDSICSAIAYADIRNRTSRGERYIPRRVGQINDETEYVLRRFGFSQPGYMPNVGTQVKDMDIFPTPHLEATMSLKRAWDLMKENNITTLPVVDAERHLVGIVTVDDAMEVLEEENTEDFQKIGTNLENASVKISHSTEVRTAPGIWAFRLRFPPGRNV